MGGTVEQREDLPPRAIRATHNRRLRGQTHCGPVTLSAPPLKREASDVMT